MTDIDAWRSSSPGRVQVLAVSTSPQVWGAERSLLALVPLLVERGIEMTLASPPGPFSEQWTALGLRHVELTVTNHRRAQNGERRPPRSAGTRR